MIKIENRCYIYFQLTFSSYFMIKSKKLVCEITPQLAEFLGEPGRKKMPRAEVTRKIDAYIQKNHLQDLMNPTNIYPDVKLMTLLLSAFNPNPRPYPKMITFEMLRDIISNHCSQYEYEDYYYRVHYRISRSKPKFICHRYSRYHYKPNNYNNYKNNDSNNDSNDITFILCMFMFIVTIVIATLYKIF